MKTRQSAILEPYNAEGDPLQVAKNLRRIADGMDGIKVVESARDDIRKAALKTRRKIHKALAKLYLAAISFDGDRSAYKRFIANRFFDTYVKKRPSADDEFPFIMRHVLRYAYDANSSDSDGYHAARRYSKKLSRYADEGVLPDDVYSHLEPAKEANVETEFAPNNRTTTSRDEAFPKTISIKASALRYARMLRRTAGTRILLEVEKGEGKAFRAISMSAIGSKR